MTNKTPRRIRIFDTTLRDGEQTPGVSLTADDKIEIAHQLSKLGVDVIEAGFPSSSEGEKKVVKDIAKAGLTSKSAHYPEQQKATLMRRLPVTLT